MIHSTYFYAQLGEAAARAENADDSTGGEKGLVWAERFSAARASELTPEDRRRASNCYTLAFCTARRYTSGLRVCPA